MDKVIIKNIQCFGILGINPDERVNKQPIIVNLSLSADTKPAAASKNIVDAVNYYDVAVRTKAFVEEAEALLVETLVNDLASMILANYPAVAKVTARVEKPDAVEFAESVGIEITRRRMGEPVEIA